MIAKHVCINSVGAAVVGLGLLTGGAEAAIYSAPAATNSVILAATWEGATHAGPGTWVRDYYGGDGDGQGGLGGDFIQIGLWDGTYRAPVFRFLIEPGTVPTGDEFTAANFEVFIAFKQNNPTFNLDLHAVSLSTDGFTVASEYQAAGTLMQAGLLSAASSYNFEDVNTNATGDSNLVDYLNANYWSASAGGTQNVFLALRLRMDGAGEAYNTFALVSNAGWGQPATLSFTTSPIPEPATLGLLAMSGMMMLGRRRQH